MARRLPMPCTGTPIHSVHKSRYGRLEDKPDKSLSPEVLPRPDQVPFLNGCECGDSGHEGYGNDGQECHRRRKEEQQSRQSVGQGVGEAETFIDCQRRYLIDKFDQDNRPGPNPQPRRNLKDRKQLDSAAHGEAEVRRAVQHGAGLGFGMQSPRQVPIDHITDAAQAIDYPESRPCRIT